eukprot:CAMPEP_0198455464 /NCGR_PEP_ID=MMETSP1453-20131121/19200_1 /TAXON_ID=1461543 ORGANISM="Unidentified sp., Strain RCC701" /NCGR_SAMPLE_ID=MMETSP1453 /ASSEMBLY_ACC=CAM_ASM_001118 /LENGTH=39 /DNA_ID= /DNA_START= /DNA_END= /DNA_ORIENTATION=
MVRGTVQQPRLWQQLGLAPDANAGALSRGQRAAKAVRTA